MKVTIYDGKYTVIQDERGRLRALRHGEEWRDCTGDELILALAQEVEDLRKRVEDLHQTVVFHTAGPFGY
jgi:ubiquinone biosynthesis protein UbiJ